MVYQDNELREVLELQDYEQFNVTDHYTELHSICSRARFPAAHLANPAKIPLSATVCLILRLCKQRRSQTSIHACSDGILSSFRRYGRAYEAFNLLPHTSSSRFFLSQIS
ncbi:hypothetical protein KFK09_007501 [Dendrobium nobile]|uniref:Uncharacterized protein n=1 Tax=Dendrobium nobile TaxID=94219 RepID=A0A8T3BVE6_DENNO|nr:hypothetical protein KFK09_007501 [Dendrobium nobile]